MNYRYDPDVRETIAQLLLETIPVYYRLAEERPDSTDELLALMRILAAPLAVARQSIEELHADLFIDTADNWVLPYLAEMVGTALVFPDAASNRADVRSTIALRRRKGTPAMLEELGETLTGQMVITQEGWRHVQMTQDLNLLRRERVLPDLRPAIVSEQIRGPFCATHHLPDLRGITATTGGFHPLHIAHWAHPTALFPLVEGDPAPFPTENSIPRYSFHPLGITLPLRARRVSQSDRRLRTDRVPPMHFDRTPGQWFDQLGGFTVRIAGLAAAVARPEEQLRQASNRLASPDLGLGSVTVQVLELNNEQLSAEVAVSLTRATRPDHGTITLLQNLGGLTATPSAEPSPLGDVLTFDTSDPSHVLLLGLSPIGTAPVRFPGAVVSIGGGQPAAGRSALDPALAREGFLRGGLFVRIPQALLTGPRWFLIADDGSCYDAQATGSESIDFALVVSSTGEFLAPANRLASHGPGPVWPPTRPLTSPDPLLSPLCAPAPGPLVLHGGQVLDGDGALLTDDAALVFGRLIKGSRAQVVPLAVLHWPGNQATPGWELESIASPASLRQHEIDAESPLFARFECATDRAMVTPLEVVWPNFDGQATLIYMPELPTVKAGTSWESDAAVGIAADGSTWNPAFNINLRPSFGDFAPLLDGIALRRRTVGYRHLCPTVPDQIAATRTGHLDLDVVNGLFALSLADRLPDYPASPNKPHPRLSVAYQEGYTAHLGARPAPREAQIQQRLLRPTRLVSASGRWHRHALLGQTDVPMYTSLNAALADAEHELEVIQFEDSATYDEGKIIWPDHTNVRRLFLQAAEGERPVIIATSAASSTIEYAELSMLGLAWSTRGTEAFVLPTATTITLRFISVLNECMRWRMRLQGTRAQRRATIAHSLTAGLWLLGAGHLTISDSVIDPGLADTGALRQALRVRQGTLEIERCTILGTVSCFILEASECLIEGDARATDRLHGCVRYCRTTAPIQCPTRDDGSLPDGSLLPRNHRPVFDAPLRFVSRDRHHFGHARLAVDADIRLRTGAADGGEIGAFHDTQLPQRFEGYRRRLEESTPAGLLTGIIRSD